MLPPATCPTFAGVDALLPTRRNATQGAYLTETGFDEVLSAILLPALLVLIVFGETNKAVSPDDVEALASPR